MRVEIGETQRARRREEGESVRAGDQRSSLWRGGHSRERSEATAAAAALNEFMLLVLLMFFMARHELRREIADSITGSYVNDGGLRAASL